MQPFADEVQIDRPLPRLVSGHDLRGRRLGIVEPESGGQLDGDRSPVSPCGTQEVRGRPVHGVNPYPFARPPFAGCPITGSEHEGSAQHDRIEHLDDLVASLLTRGRARMAGMGAARTPPPGTDLILTDPPVRDGGAVVPCARWSRPEPLGPIALGLGDQWP